jgi:glyoxylase-like metal-dependent hydrolase (beta-lactamase superfamily II)
MQVAPGFFLVDGMERGVVNAYVWERADGHLTLIDTGMPGDAGKILAFLRHLGLERLDRIILTHGDIDHIGGCPEVQRVTHARVVSHAVEKDVIEGRRPRPMGHGLLSRVYAPLFRLVSKTLLHFEPVSHVDELVVDRQVLLEGLQVIHVPGHSPGQIALFEPGRGILVAADALNNRNGKLGAPPAIATPHMDIAMDSIRKLAALKGIQVVCFGHGLPLVDDAAQRLQDFAAGLPGAQPATKR